MNELSEAYSSFVTETFEDLADLKVIKKIELLKDNENIKNISYDARLLEIELEDGFLEDSRQSIIDVFLYGGILRKKVGDEIINIKIEGYGAI